MVKRIHPAWISMVKIFMVMFSLYSIAYNTTSLFIDPISTDLGISRTATNLIITLRSIGSIITLSISGYFFSRFGIKKMMIAGATGVGLTMFLFSFSTSIPMMYICYFCMGLSLGYISDLSCSMILNNWFSEKASLANGISATGSGLGGAFYSSITGYLIANLGWRFSYRFLAIVGFIMTIIPILSIVVYPSEIGAKPLGIGNKESQVEHKGVYLKDIVKNPVFWAMWVCTILLSYFNFVIIVGLPAHLLDVGYSIEITGNISAIMLILMALMKVVLGYMYDSFDISLVLLFASLALIVGIFSVLNVTNPIFLIPLMVSFATGSANFAQSLQGVTRNLFGRKDYGSILKVFMIGSNGGGLVCPAISGLVYDLTGSYIALYKILIIPAFVLLITIQLITRRVQNEITSSFK